MISREDVRHIARLARLALTAQEEEKFAGELSAILEFAEKLNAADTEGVAPMTGGSLREHIVRDDAAADGALEGRDEKLRDAAAERKGDWIKVKAVFE